MNLAPLSLGGGKVVFQIIALPKSHWRLPLFKIKTSVLGKWSFTIIKH